MSEPVLVVHGVKNRDEGAFRAQVAALERLVGGRWNFVPVWWGDLGAASAHVVDVIPSAGGATLRALEDTLARATASEPSAVRASPRGLADVLEGVAERRGAAASAVRSADDPLARAIEDHFPRTTWLPRLAAGSLREIGGLLQDAVGPGPDEPSAVVRGFADGLRDKVKRVLGDLDQLVGGLIGDAAGAVNRMLREQLLPDVTEFLGDVFVYQRSLSIQDRLFRALPDGWGTEDKPVNVVAHSLGGLVSFDAAVLHEPRLWIKKFVTFGSQPAFFHVLDPRAGLTRYTPGGKVRLPPQIRRWISLWEPMDPLGFLAGSVFTHGNDDPEDFEVAHLVTSGLWTHSSYWTHPEVARHIGEFFAREPQP